MYGKTYGQRVKTARSVCEPWRRARAAPELARAARVASESCAMPRPAHAHAAPASRLALLCALLLASASAAAAPRFVASLPAPRLCSGLRLSNPADSPLRLGSPAAPRPRGLREAVARCWPATACPASQMPPARAPPAASAATPPAAARWRRWPSRPPASSRTPVITTRWRWSAPLQAPRRRWLRRRRARRLLACLRQMPR